MNLESELVSEYKEQRMYRMHTHFDYLLPVPIAEVVIQSIASRSWSHFLGTLGSRIDVCPTSLRRLAVSPPNALCKVKRKPQVTCLDVSRKVELGNEIANVLDAVRQSFLGREDLHPFAKLLMPLTRNIV